MWTLFGTVFFFVVVWSAKQEHTADRKLTTESRKKNNQNKWRFGDLNWPIRSKFQILYSNRQIIKMRREKVSVIEGGRWQMHARGCFADAKKKNKKITLPCYQPRSETVNGKGKVVVSPSFIYQGWWKCVSTNATLSSEDKTIDELVLARSAYRFSSYYED